MPSCNLVDSSDCLASPGSGRRTRAECFACGLPVCRKCSVVTDYLRYGRKRLCFGCIRDGCLGTLPRGQRSLLESLTTAQRRYGCTLVDRIYRQRVAREEAEMRGFREEAVKRRKFKSF